MNNVIKLSKLEKKKNLILKDKNLYRSIIILAIPIFLSNLLKSIHSFVDMYFVAPLGEKAITAITVTNPVLAISQALAAGFMIAGVAIMSQAIGARQNAKARKIAGQLLNLCIMTGIAFTLILFIATPFIMSVIGTQGETFNLSVLYVRTRSLEMIPLFTYFAFHASRQASGDTLTPFLFNIVSVLINIALTWYFVAVLEMGVYGAALATVISSAIIMPFYIIMMAIDRKAEVYITLEDVKYDGVEAKRIMQLGFPAAFAQAFTSLGFLILNAIILSYGETTVSAFSIGNQINSLILMPAMGIGGVIATFIGQNIGAGNPSRAKESFKTAMILTVGIMIAGAAILMPLREVLGSIFLKNNPEALALSVEYMFFLLIGLPLMAIFQVFMGTYQGAGYTKFSLILAVARLWGMRIPMVLIFKDILLLESSCIWYAMTISNFGTTIIGIILFGYCKFEIDKSLLKEELTPA